MKAGTSKVCHSDFLTIIIKTAKVIFLLLCSNQAVREFCNTVMHLRKNNKRFQIQNIQWKAVTEKTKSRLAD